MASGAQELVGLEAFSREGDKVGKIRDVICDPGSLTECLVIKHSLRRDLIVPADMVERHEQRVTIPFGSAYLDMAPRPAKKGELSSEERTRLESFYHPTAA
jgi:sporulation protein YlmC with PRC-barrel domain